MIITIGNTPNEYHLHFRDFSDFRNFMLFCFSDCTYFDCDIDNVYNLLEKFDGFFGRSYDSKS